MSIVHAYRLYAQALQDHWFADWAVEHRTARPAVPIHPKVHAALEDQLPGGVDWLVTGEVGRWSGFRLVRTPLQTFTLRASAAPPVPVRAPYPVSRLVAAMRYAARGTN
jgi:hypothetical protein